MKILLHLLIALALLVGGTLLIVASASEQRTRSLPQPVPSVAAARDSLIRSPLDDGALERLVRADDAAHRWNEEKRLIALSQRLSKRNVATRFMALATAAAEGDLAAAVRDADLLLRQRAYQDSLFAFLRDAAASADGRLAIANRLAARPDWREDLLIREQGLTPARHADAVALLAAMRATAPPTRNEVESLAQRLVAAGDVAPARALRTLFAPPSPHLLVDGRFTQPADSPSGLFGWSRGDSPSPDRRGGLSLDATSTGIAARQVTFAPPGRHRLRWSIETPPSALTLQLDWTIRCTPGPGIPLRRNMPPDISGRSPIYRQAIFIPDNCPMQIVEMATVSSVMPSSARLRWTTFD